MRPPGRTPALLIALVLILFSIITSREAYEQLIEQREQLRLGSSSSAGLVAGPARISGHLEATETLLVAPGSGVASIYYRLQTEQRCKRQNESTWCVVDTEERIAPFSLHDADGSVHTELAQPPIVLAPPVWQQREGQRRLREWRLEPGDHVEIIADVTTQPLRLNIDADSRVLKTDGLGQTNHRDRKSGLLTLFFSIVLLAFALLLLSSALRWHRILIYCGLLSGILCGKLLLDGINLTQRDLNAGLSAVEERLHQVEAALEARLKELQRPTKLDWSASQLQQLRAIQDRRIDALLETLQSALLAWQQQSEQWPAALLNLAPPAHWQGLLALPAPATLQASTLPSPNRWQMPLPLLLVLAIVIAVVSGRTALRRVKLARTFENLSTTDIAGVQAGLNEITAQVQASPSAALLKAPLSGEPCVWYDLKIMERTDDSRHGRRQWRTVKHERSHGTIQLKDETGTIDLDLAAAEVSGGHQQVYSRGRQRQVETCLQAGDQVYVLGSCTYDWDQQGERLIERSDAHPLLVTTHAESRIQFEQGFAGLAAMTLSFCSLVGIGLLLLWQSEQTTVGGILLSAAIPVCALTVISIIIHYNDLIFLRERVRRNEANVEVALQQRHDLIERLVEIAQAGLAHERSLQADLARLRQLPDRSEFGLQQWDAALAQSERGMKALIEQYPQLQAITLIQSLMANLSEQDTGVASARASLNHAIEHYMTRKHQIPDVWLAKLGRFPNIALWSHPARVTASPDTQPTQQ